MDECPPRHSSTEGLRRGLGRETELREPVLHVEVEPVARDNPVLDRHDVALAEPHTPARRGNGLAVRAGVRPDEVSLVDRRVAGLVLVPVLLRRHPETPR